LRSKSQRLAQCIAALGLALSPGAACAEGFFGFFQTWEKEGFTKAVDEAMSGKGRDLFGDALNEVYEPAGKAWEAGGHTYDIHKDGFDTIERMFDSDKTGKDPQEVYGEFEKRMKNKGREMLEGLVPEPVKNAYDKLRGASDWAEDVVEDSRWAAEKVDQAVEGGGRIYQDYFGSNATEAFDEDSADRQMLMENSSIATQGYLPSDVVEDFVDPESPGDYQAFVDSQDTYESWDDAGRNESAEVINDYEPQDRYAQELSADEEPMEAGDGPSAFSDSDTEPSLNQSGTAEAPGGNIEPDLEAEIDSILSETIDQAERARTSSGGDSSSASRQRLADATRSSSAGGWGNAIGTVINGTAIASDTYNRGGSPSPLLNMLPPAGGRRGSSSGYSASSGSMSTSECASLPRQFDINRCDEYKQCSRMQAEANQQWLRDSQEALNAMPAKDRADVLHAMELSTNGSREIASSPCDQIPAVLARHQVIAEKEARRLGIQLPQP